MSELTEMMEQLQILQKKMALLAQGETPVAAVAKKFVKVGNVGERKATAGAHRRPVAPALVKDFITWFIKAPEGELYNVSRGQWECQRGYFNSDKDKQAHTLIFHTALVGRVADASNIVCIRPIGSKVAIFNGSRITYGTSYDEQKGPQAIAEAAGAVPVPFQSVVSKKEGAGLDLAHLEIVEWTGPEKLIIPPVNQNRWRSVDFHVINRHFAGAAVLKVHDQYFLFDADREELKYHGFNPFFTQLPHAVKNVREAYEALMPQAVKDALAEGKRVIRQGELFFVPVGDPVVRTFLGHETWCADHETFFYEQLKGRLRTLGAAVVNCAKQDQLSSLTDFLTACNVNNRGLLDGSKINAEEALAVHRTYLATIVGSGIAVPPPRKRKKSDGSMDWGIPRGTSHMDSHLRYVWDELRQRTSEDPNDMVDGRPICLGSGIATDTTDPRAAGARHSATGMVAKKGSKEVYVIGAILHSGREHRPVYLDDWHRVYPNTATHNWTVSGNVD